MSYMLMFDLLQSVQSWKIQGPVVKTAHTWMMSWTSTLTLLYRRVSDGLRQVKIVS